MANSNRIRIIGGEHRGRKLGFVDAPGLRPTGDRMRETLFNWLQPVIPGARVLDLFAGSGALGFEAASRGAGELVMVERAARVARQLRDNAALLRLEQARVEQADALQWLRQSPRPFDIVFLDPPFADDLLAKVLSGLPAGWLNPGALVYLETDARQGLPQLPQCLHLQKQKCMGEVLFGLARYATPG